MQEWPTTVPELDIVVNVGANADLLLITWQCFQSFWGIWFYNKMERAIKTETASVTS